MPQSHIRRVWEKGILVPNRRLGTESNSFTATLLILHLIVINHTLPPAHGANGALFTSLFIINLPSKKVTRLIQQSVNPEGQEILLKYSPKCDITYR